MQGVLQYTENFEFGVPPCWEQRGQRTISPGNQKNRAFSDEIWVIEQILQPLEVGLWRFGKKNIFHFLLRGNYSLHRAFRVVWNFWL